MLVRRLILSHLLFVTTICPASLAQGEARTLPVGGYRTQVGIAWHTADRQFGLDGRERSLFADTASFRDASFGQTDISLIGEIGILDWLTATAETHFRTLVQEARYVPTRRDSTISASGLGDLWLRARVHVLQTDDSNTAAVTLGWKAPTGSPRQELPLGTGVADYSLGGAFRAPWDLGIVRTYAEASLTYLLRLKAANELMYSLELGLYPGRGVLVYGVLEGTYSGADFDAALANPSENRINESLAGDQSYTGWELGLRLAVDDDLEIGFLLADRMSGRNTPASSSFGLLLAWHGP
jgi:hypothetical protein